MFVALAQLTDFAFSKEGSARADEKEGHCRARHDNQGIKRGHEGASPRTKGRFAGIFPAAAGADDARRREVKAQPKVAAKTTKTPVKAKPAAKA
ncbi:MAG TPA: hypothetical protein VIL30_27605, partial [Ramlibacter sp.]